MRRCFLWLFVFFAAIDLPLTPAQAQRGLDPNTIPAPDPAEELKALVPAEGFEINLFAADPMIAAPIQMNWDPAGRLWIASSEVYPQIKPGQVANDKIIVLEDTDGDGRADKRTVFTDGLLIPTAVIPGDGGAYVANSTELLHLSDTDGDGRADKERVVLSGFGTEDTHHILHTLRWGPGQRLYFNQSIYIHSHLETPWGVQRLGGGGTWQLQPSSLKLAVVMRGCVNPWGLHWDRWGASFVTDGAYGDGICYTFPGATFATAPGAKDTIRGLNPGQPKDCGLEILSGRHLPDEWQGRMITNDFRGHRTTSFIVSEDGSGFSSRRVEDLIASSHVAFRPIDIKMGSDGAIYIADWYNPIIQHGEVDFRDPRRDHAHGRIWRITAKGRPLVEPPKLVGATVDQLLDALKLPEEWTRSQAKRLLAERGAETVQPHLNNWVAALSPEDADFEHHRLEALWVYQAIDVPDESLLRAVLASPDPRARASAVRVLSLWHDRVGGAMDLLASALADEHPRVRLEAVCTLNVIGTPDALRLCLEALNKPVDTFIEHALKIALLGRTGGSSLADANRLPQLMFRLEYLQDASAIEPLLKMADGQDLTGGQRAKVLAAVGRVGNPQHLAAVLDRVLAAAPDNPPSQIGLLGMLQSAATIRKVKPSGDLNRITKLYDHKNQQFRIAAIQLVGAWRLESQRAALTASAQSPDVPVDVRAACIAALARFGSAEDKATLTKLMTGDSFFKPRLAAVTALATLDRRAAAAGAAQLLADMPKAVDPSFLIGVFLLSKDGPKELAAALGGKTLNPDLAKLAIRAIESSGQSLPELVAAFRAAGRLDAKRQWSAAEINQLVAEVQQHGDPARGELVFRRANLSCVKCHAIGGAGGHVGPDLVSIGASAQVDYLIESLLEPNKKIKENYHSLIVETNEGRLLTGVNVGKTNQHLILRDAEDREIRIPLDEIASEENGASLMPAGLTDALTGTEFADLVRFLSELGKEGPFSLGQRQWVRRWEAALPTEANADFVRHNSVGAVAEPDAAIQWGPLYSTVAGKLPVHDIPALVIPARGLNTGIVRFRIEVTTPGAVQLNWNSTDALNVWLDGQPVELANGTTVADLARGMHVVTVATDLEHRHEDVQVELLEAAGSNARARLVTD